MARLIADVGGTNTDAVLLTTDDSLVAKTKTPTTEDVTGGIRVRRHGVDGAYSEPGHSKWVT